MGCHAWLQRPQGEDCGSGCSVDGSCSANAFPILLSCGSPCLFKLSSIHPLLLLLPVSLALPCALALNCTLRTTQPLSLAVTSRVRSPAPPCISPNQAVSYPALSRCSIRYNVACSSTPMLSIPLLAHKHPLNLSMNLAVPRPVLPRRAPHLLTPAGLERPH